MNALQRQLFFSFKPLSLQALTGFETDRALQATLAALRSIDA